MNKFLPFFIKHSPFNLASFSILLYNTISTINCANAIILLFWRLIEPCFYFSEGLR